MIILSHRGFWINPTEKNTPTAFNRSFEAGFGTETDVRDSGGEIVISHDPPSGGELSLSDFLALHGKSQLPLAMNIKADGLASTLRRAMEGVPNWFAFDASVPDLRAHLDAGNPTLTRMSEVEPTPAYLHRCAGVWLDSFEGTWFDASMIEELLDLDKWVFVVSPELHRRDHLPCWSILECLSAREKLVLCTDHPLLARAHFGVSP
jgi:glycerophosphoryl diester phosphodiesterase